MRSSSKKPNNLPTDSSKSLVGETPFMALLLNGSDYRIRFASRQLRELAGDRSIIGNPLAQAIPELQAMVPLLDRMREAERRGELTLQPRCMKATLHPEWQLEWFAQALDSSEPDAGSFALFSRQLDPSSSTGSVNAHDLKRLSEITNSLLAVVDFQGRHRRIGPAFRRLLGWSEQEIVGQPITNLIHPADRDRSRREIRRISMGGKPRTEYENRLLHKDGSTRWFAWTAVVVYEEEAIYTVGRDITEARQAEDRLRQQAEFNAFRITLADSIRQLDDSGQIQREAAKAIAAQFAVSRVSFATVHGGDVLVKHEYAPDVPSSIGRHRMSEFGGMIAAASGRTVILENAAEDPRLNDQAKLAYRRLGISAMVAIRLMKRGQIHAVMTIADPQPRTWTDAEVKLMDEAAERVWVAMERATAETALRKSEERYRWVSSATNDVIWDWNVETDRIEWNEAALSQFGYTREELAQTVEDWCSRIHPEDRERVLTSHKHALANGRETWSEEYRFHKSDGSYGVFLERGHIARDISGKPHRMIGSMVNLTERRRDEEALRAANAQLAESDRRKDEYLAMLAHELRNPLAAVRNAAELLGTDISKSRMRHYVDILRRQIQALSRLVDDLLDVARLTRGLVTLKREPVNLASVVTGALESVRPSLQQKRHELTVTFPHEPLCVIGDPIRLEQILVNLIANAAKYTNPGGAITVIVIASARNGCADIRVRDTGIGIAPETQERIFGLFGQVERGIDRTEGGLGIGLTVVKSLVELHGGSVELHSPGLGQGAEFTVLLPLAPATEAAEPETETTDSDAPLEQPQTATRRILVVDDNSDVAETLAELLRQQGNEVATANDGPSAVEKAENLHPDLVLLDIGLPGMDGYEVARRLRQSPPMHDVVLAALTGYGQESDRERTSMAGFDAHFVKPVELGLLKSFIYGLRPAEGKQP